MRPRAMEPQYPGSPSKLKSGTNGTSPFFKQYICIIYIIITYYYIYIYIYIYILYMYLLNRYENVEDKQRNIF